MYDNIAEVDLYSPDGLTRIPRPIKVKYKSKRNPARLFVDKVYCIRDSTDNVRLEKLLDYMGIDVKYIKKAHPGSYSIRPEHESTWYTHYKIWGDIVTNKYRMVLILGDEIDISLNIREVLDPIVEKLYPKDTNAIPDWDVFYAGHCSVVENSGEIVYRGLEKLRYGATPKCLHGYMVNYEGANKLLDKFVKMQDIPLDLAILRDAKFNATDPLKLLSLNPAHITKRPDVYHPKIAYDGIYPPAPDSALNFIGLGKKGKY
ncbi:hypothetical protein H4219_004542 [Mycoemilia scoparia]|uniref:Uncharacterized protein n=1 Tax=Mycoemilia scoparia TaxID=417184 RepID=A0A9W8A0W0_9FUNG|nr:hypothetical protein H4219_004542 [Mycoemilia scoparia]